MSKREYLWKLDKLPNPWKGTVFSCFGSGGGSSMGYKLAGFDVIGFNEIDPEMADIYKRNLNPKFSYVEDIRRFADRGVLPNELYDLDILDGSPPCSTFSSAGKQEAGWGKEKVFREGQVKQVLDTLFFDFIKVARKLQPKIVVAENVKGLLFKKAKHYVDAIHKGFKDSGYVCNHYLLNGANMGLPQKRQRVFFVAVRNDIASDFMEQGTLFPTKHRLRLDFDMPKVPYREIREDTPHGSSVKIYPSTKRLWHKTEIGRPFSDAYERETGRSSFFTYRKLSPNHVCNTVTAHTAGSGDFDYEYLRGLTKNELLRASSFPLDYDFMEVHPKYVMGMSVPPLMMKRIANEIYKQILSKL